MIGTYLGTCSNVYRARQKLNRFVLQDGSKINRQYVKLRCIKEDIATQSLALPDWKDTPEQVGGLEELKQMLYADGFTNLDEDDLKWYLRDRDFSAARAYKKLIKAYKWRQAFGVQDITYETVKEQAITKKAYLHDKRDKFGRQIVLVRPSRHIIGSAPPLKAKQLGVYIVQEALGRMDPAYSDYVIAVFDMRQFGPRNADIEFVGFLVELFFFYYPKRVQKVLFVEAPWMFRPVWSSIKPVLGKYAQLAKFISVDELKRDFIDHHNLPDEFK